MISLTRSMAVRYGKHGIRGRRDRARHDPLAASGRSASTRSRRSSSGSSAGIRWAGSASPRTWRTQPPSSPPTTRRGSAATVLRVDGGLLAGNAQMARELVANFSPDDERSARRPDPRRPCDRRRRQPLVRGRRRRSRATAIAAVGARRRAGRARDRRRRPVRLPGLHRHAHALRPAAARRIPRHEAKVLPGRDARGARPGRPQLRAGHRRRCSSSCADSSPAGTSDPPGFDWSWRTVGEYLDRLDADGIAINAAYLAPHGTIRMCAMGYDDRAPTADELAHMKRLLAEALEQGAVGPVDRV